MAHPVFRRKRASAELAAAYSAFASGATFAGTAAGVRVNTSGVVQTRQGTTYTTASTWLLSGLSSDYECRITGVTGETPTGAASGTWVNCSTSPEWYIQDASADSVEAFSTFTLQIGLAGTSTAIDSAVVDLTADRV